MKVQFRCRRLAPAALAVFLLIQLGFAPVAGATGSSPEGGREKSSDSEKSRDSSKDSEKDKSKDSDKSKDRESDAEKACAKSAAHASDDSEAKTCVKDDGAEKPKDDGKADDGSEKPKDDGKADDDSAEKPKDDGKVDSEDDSKPKDDCPSADSKSKSVSAKTGTKTGTKTCTPATTCPDGKPMPASGKCTTGDVSGTDVTPPCAPLTSSNPCGPSSPSCVASAADNRCGGPAVLASTVTPPVQVLGVTLTRGATAGAADPAVASAGLARTGISPFELLRVALAIVMGGSGLVAVARMRRRPDAVDIDSRMAGF
jgi:hypothetical protein